MYVTIPDTIYSATVEKTLQDYRNRITAERLKRDLGKKRR